MSHAYSHLYGLPTTGLRFFTVYGPWGRPDMALFSFTKAIVKGEAIDVYNQGDMYRDFTYVDDIVEGVIRVLDKPAQASPEWSGDEPDSATSYAPWRVYNIGNNKQVMLMEFIEAIEDALGKEAVKNMLPMQPGDVQSTVAETADLEMVIGSIPTTSIRDGVTAFLGWYRGYDRAGEM